MKRILVFLFFTLSLIFQLKGQCPQIYNSSFDAPFCQNNIIPCEVCEEDEIILSAEGLILPDGGCVNWYYKSSSQFLNSNDGEFIGCSEIKAENPCSICMELLYIMANPSGNDIENEFVVFNSGGGFEANQIILDFDEMVNNIDQQNDDIGFNTCSISKPNYSLPGCPDAQPLGTGDYIPQNSIIVVFTSSDAQPSYDFSKFCDLGAPIFYTQNSCERTIEAFPNEVNGASVNQGIGNLTCGCSSFFSYSKDFENEGDFISLDGKIGNETTFAPEPDYSSFNSIKNEIESFSFRVNDQMCDLGKVFIRGVLESSDQTCSDAETSIFELEIVCPKAEISAPDSVCVGEEVSIIGRGGEDLIWSNGNANSAFTETIFAEKKYELLVQTGNCVDVTEHMISVYAEGHEKCECITDAGSQNIPANPIEFCQLEKAILPPNQEVVLDRNDAITYVLHKSEIFDELEIIERNVIPEFEFDPVLMSTEITYYISALAGDQSNSSFVDYLDDCLSIGPAIPIIFKAPPVAFLLGESVVCEGEFSSIQVVSNGNPPFTFSISENGNLLPQQTTNLGVFDLQIQPNSNTVYEIENFEDASCAGVVFSPPIEVEVLPAIQINLIEPITFPNGTYSLKLDISGGELPYDFSNHSARLENGFYITNPIQCGEITNFCVNDNLCTETCISEKIDCQSNCSNFAGNMANDSLHLCLFDEAVFSHSDAIYKDNQLLEFILHSSAGNSLGTIFKKTSTPEFEYTSDLRPEVVYYFSAVTGEDDGSGHVDLDDPCLSVAAGTPVVFHNFPEVVLPQQVEVCRNVESEIYIDFIGHSPFSYNFEIDNFQFPQATSDIERDTFKQSFDKSRMVTISSINDRYCMNQIEEQFEVEVFENLGVENLNLNCSSDGQSYNVSFDVSGSNSSSLFIDGKGDLSNSSFLSEDIQNGENYSFEIYDSSGCDTLVLEGKFDCNCQNFAGNLKPLTTDNSPLVICGTDEFIAENSGDAIIGNNEKLEFIIQDKSGPDLGNILDNNDSGVFTFKNHFQRDKIYYVSAAVGERNNQGQLDFSDPCLNVSVGRPVVFQSLPNASFTIGNEICEGDSALLGFTFEGLPPFLLNFEIEENGALENREITAVSNSHFEFFNPNIEEGIASFNLVSVESFGCKVALSGAQSVTVKPASKTYLNNHICGDDSLTLFGEVFHENNLIDTFKFQTITGCDSIVYVELSHQEIDTNFIEKKICENEILEIKQTVYDIENPEGIELFSTDFCDSLVAIKLDFYPTYLESFFDTICMGQTVEIDDYIFSEENPKGEIFYIDKNGCDSTITVQIHFENPENLELELENEISIQAGKSINLSPTFQGQIGRIEWSPSDLVSCSDCLITSASPVSNTTFKISIWDEFGCYIEDEIEVSVLADQQVYIPNSFSPNNDGINDYFMVYGSPVVAVVEKLQVFDRWGNQIYSAKELEPNKNNDGWDGYFNGKLMDSGVYIYQAQIRYNDGKTELFKGDISIF